MTLGSPQALNPQEDFSDDDSDDSLDLIEDQDDDI